MKNRIFTYFQSTPSPTKYSLITKESSNYSGEAWQTTPSSNDPNDQHRQGEGHTVTSVLFLSRMNKLEVVMRKHQTNPNSRNGHVIFKCVKIMEVENTQRKCSRLRLNGMTTTYKVWFWMGSCRVSLEPPGTLPWVGCESEMQRRASLHFLMLTAAPRAGGGAVCGRTHTEVFTGEEEHGSIRLATYPPTVGGGVFSTSNFFVIVSK